jgi:hypothetical protein
VHKKTPAFGALNAGAFIYSFDFLGATSFG